MEPKINRGKVFNWKSNNWVVMRKRNLKMEKSSVAWLILGRDGDDMAT